MRVGGWGLDGAPRITLSKDGSLLRLGGAGDYDVTFGDEVREEPAKGRGARGGEGGGRGEGGRGKEEGGEGLEGGRRREAWTDGRRGGERLSSCRSRNAGGGREEGRLPGSSLAVGMVVL